MSGYSPVIVAKAQETRTQWAWHLGALALLVGLILLFFQFEVFNAVEVWWIYPTYSHCFLIIPIAAWLVWQMRHDLGASMPAIAPKALLAIPPLLLLWLLGKLATINEVRQFAVIGLIEVAILTMLGARLYRAILFPALYLFFLVPFGQYFIPPMQLFATWFTDAGLNLLGVPHYTEGTVIELTTGRFEVAEACAGLRFLIATIALGVLFAHLTYRKWYKIVTFLPACIIIPLIGNGLRCLGIIMLAYLTNNEVAVGADHLVYGWLFNMAILLVLFFFGTRFRDPAAEPTKVVDNNVQAVSRFSVLMLATATALTIGAGPAFAYWRESRPIFVNSQALTQPFTLGGWTVAQLPGPWHPIYEGADQEFFASFVPGSSRVRAVHRHMASGRSPHRRDATGLRNSSIRRNNHCLAIRETARMVVLLDGRAVYDEWPHDQGSATPISIHWKRGCCFDRSIDSHRWGRRGRAHTSQNGSDGANPSPESLG